MALKVSGAFPAIARTAASVAASAAWKASMRSASSRAQRNVPRIGCGQGPYVGG